ncbi:ATP-binding cassette domain-containing protein [Roseibium sp. CAU 1637]|uniref:ATP-binding cassette domain-containing protein n=1 Tax=Roseibium limicola TaxID=2816037 RepID=A0A939J5D6_9HYPH|nr:ATP-binding cassette domain-containing protein [Roseibium limicola]MBO0343957.1 ATP-binding cassette domain-containing protein [Roseibium limicola]
MIDIQNVTYHHGRSLILDDVSLRLKKGGITALVGPNGAGKSTLFALMARLLPLQSGSIRFDEMEVGKTGTQSLARKLAILRQEANVASRITVRDLVGFGRFPHHQGRASEADEAFVQKSLHEFDLASIADRFIDELSGGQRQRALVAMAFAQDTDYLLLDEPLNNLDMYFARSLMQQLRALADAYGKTIVIVLHEINYASGHADEIIALKQGRVALQAPPESFMTAENLFAIYGMDVQVETFGNRKIALHQV